MIVPTVGRIVHLRRITDPVDGEPCAAVITSVLDDRRVNIAYWDGDGTMRKVQRVQLRQGDDEDAQKGDYWVEWMPYQKAVASGEIAPNAHAVAVSKANKQVSK